MISAASELTESVEYSRENPRELISRFDCVGELNVVLGVILFFPSYSARTLFSNLMQVVYHFCFKTCQKEA